MGNSEIFFCGAMVLQLDIFNKPVYRKEDCVTDISYLVPKMKQRKVY